MTERQEQTDALVIGAGPAGLMAAEVLAATGRRVLVLDQKPSVGRKFLMAGRSGLNLTKSEDPATFARVYGPSADWLGPMLRAFGPEQVTAWAEGLGQPVFTGSTGRVFPRAMKASPLLRAWLARLRAARVEIRPRWRFDGWDGPAARFGAPDGPAQVLADATVLAMGGASWARLGSDGAWTAALRAAGAPCTPFAASNVGLRVAWSDHMTRHFGTPVKGVALVVLGRRHRGEFIVSARGLEGGGIYAVSAAVRDGAALTLDLLPDLDTAAVIQRLARPRGGQSLSNHLRRTLRLPPVSLALAREWAGPLPTDPAALAALLKAVPLRHDGPRPLDEAISTVGGLPRATLTDGLMLKARPGVFCAGEMLDWDAPTGGYLLTGCFATGRWAGLAAAEWLTGASVDGPDSPRLI
ncbi:aminoacetone oxidase family FAD-binding enzyme [Meridianimarinicoccus roseus]|uniref:Aminoacetone oxidase family FAD-binding enzyme n=1 Tax=Meridianimarinicoccus roseus TaxID=2072018 RepID=A0A2V2LKK1_9RHOB|nr:TIGR03862 family flavoprotein [Meridianimarinicoccus roseus]PWR02829.1 aminoacetone oxidase family FAD-binding enzyme [Meridianimarinicoccus roseus]